MFKEEARTKEKALGAMIVGATSPATAGRQLCVESAPGRAIDALFMKLPALSWCSRNDGRHGGPDSSDVYQALIGSGVFSKTDPDVVSTLSKQLEPVHFPPGHVVVGQGDIDSCLYVIISGKAKVSYRHPDGCEIVLTLLGPSDMVGAITLFDPSSCEVTVTSLTEVQAVPIERDQFLVWMAERPEISEQLLRLFARWAKATTNSLVDFAFADEQNRLASRLLWLRQRFGWQEGEVVRVEHDLTSEDFSLLVGVASETISATLRDFEDRGWIRLEDNSMVIVDGQALTAGPVPPMSFSGICCGC